MKIGKLPAEVLEEIVLNPIRNNKVKRSDIIVRPKTGEDCSAVDLEGELCVVSTDPITGAQKDAGYIAVHINCNDVASSGAEPIGILLTALLPESTSQEEFEEIMEGAYRAAKELHIEILGGHTEVTDAVTRPVISGTVIGRTMGRNFISSGGAREGQSVIMTKWAGLEGTAIIASDYSETVTRCLGRDVCKGANELKKYLSVVREGLIARQYGATAMHDVTEGGILGAVWEVSDCSGLGVLIELDKIPVRPETEKICALAKIDPYRLISSGSMIITTFEEEKLMEAFQREGIEAAVIGKMTAKGKYIIHNGEKSVLKAPESDELYHINFSDK